MAKKTSKQLLEVELDGVKYSLRRLAASDIEAFNDICGAVLAGAEFRGVPFNLDGESWEEHITDILIKGMPFAQRDINDWLETLPIDYPKDQPIYLPDYPTLVEAAVTHPDIKLFLERSKKLVATLLELANKLMSTNTTQTD